MESLIIILAVLVFISILPHNVLVFMCCKFYITVTKYAEKLLQGERERLRDREKEQGSRDKILFNDTPSVTGLQPGTTPTTSQSHEESLSGLIH
jgi:hypothetical protein